MVYHALRHAPASPHACHDPHRDESHLASMADTGCEQCYRLPARKRSCRLVRLLAWTAASSVPTAQSGCARDRDPGSLDARVARHESAHHCSDHAWQEVVQEALRTLGHECAVLGSPWWARVRTSPRVDLDTQLDSAELAAQVGARRIGGARANSHTVLRRMSRIVEVEVADDVSSGLARSLQRWEGSQASFLKLPGDLRRRYTDCRGEDAASAPRCVPGAHTCAPTVAALGRIALGSVGTRSRSCIDHRVHRGRPPDHMAAARAASSAPSTPR